MLSINGFQCTEYALSGDFVHKILCSAPPPPSCCGLVQSGWAPELATNLFAQVDFVLDKADLAVTAIHKWVPMHGICFIRRSCLQNIVLGTAAQLLRAGPVWLNTRIWLQTLRPYCKIYLWWCVCQKPVLCLFPKGLVDDIPQMSTGV